MTLAAIIVTVSFALPPRSLARVLFTGTARSTQAKASDSTSTQDQSNPQPQNSQNQPQGSQTPSPQSEPSGTPAHKSSTSTQPPKHKSSTKTAAQPDCNTISTNAAAQGPPEPAKPSAEASQAGSNPPPVKAAPPPANCPPQKKIVVQQGGTSEPSIQIVGGTDNSPARDANQLLQSTEDNLKKISGRQLTDNQKNVVTQIHQFMAQSKTATAAGDLESARTLAWKAQALSENLVNPEK